MVHCHFEIAKGKYKGKWYKNSDGVYCLYNSIKFYDAFFMDGVELIDISSDVKAKFVYAENKQNEIETLKKQIVTLNEQITVLNSQLAEKDRLVEEKETEIDNLVIQADQLKSDKESLQFTIDNYKHIMKQITQLTQSM
jgi:hypothetical protein